MKLPGIALPAALLMTLPAHAVTLISDDFSSTPTNPNDLGWYSSSAGTSVFSAASGGLQFTSNTATTNQSVFKQFSETTIGVGQVMTLTMNFTAMSTIANSSNVWRISLFNTSNTFTANQGSTPWTGFNEGYQFTVSTAPSAGGGAFASNIYYKPQSTGIVSTNGSTSVSSVADRIPADGGIPLTMSLSVQRISATQVSVYGYWLENGTNQGTFAPVILTSDVNYVDTFDTIYAAYGAGESGRGFTIDDVTLTLENIPEPSHAALLAGSLGLLALRRRRI